MGLIRRMNANECNCFVCVCVDKKGGKKQANQNEMRWRSCLKNKNNIKVQE